MQVRVWNVVVTAVVEAVERSRGCVVDFSGGELLLFWHGHRTACPHPALPPRFCTEPSHCARLKFCFFCAWMSAWAGVFCSAGDGVCAGADAHRLPPHPRAPPDAA
eukprot:1088063-Rhodomonas_salina.1